MITGNQYQHFRRMFIDGILRNINYTSKEDILTDLRNAYDAFTEGAKTISDRTFEEDWKFIKEELQSNGFRLLKKLIKKKWCYRYSNTDFTINHLELSKHEIKKLSDSIKLLQQVKGIDMDNELSSILEKLDTQVRHYHSGQEDFISIQNGATAKGYHFIDDIYDAIREKTALKITYKPYQKDAFESVIHPYHLRNYNNRWFLFGWEEERQYVANLALDRIVKIGGCFNAYQSPDGIFSAKAYFGNMIGVTRSPQDMPEKIKLSFKKERAPYVVTKPVHPTQQVTPLKNGSVRIELELIVNKELVQLMLSFGSDVNVLAPKSLKNIIRQHAEEILNRL